MGGARARGAARRGWGAFAAPGGPPYHSPEQAAAWSEGIPLLQREAGELLDQRHQARGYGAVLEYLLPYDGRRPDVLVLAEGAVVVVVPTKAAGTRAARSG